MDLKAYYQKIREVEQAIAESCVVTVSLETPDGGKAGVPAEVPRSIAARMVVEGRARLASAEETREFQERRAEARRAAEQAAAAGRMQIAVVPASELRALKSARPGKE